MKSAKELHNDLLRLKEERQKLLEALSMTIKAGDSVWVINGDELVEERVRRDGLDGDGDVRTSHGYRRPERLFFCRAKALSKLVENLQESVKRTIDEISKIKEET